MRGKAAYAAGRGPLTSTSGHATEHGPAHSHASTSEDWEALGRRWWGHIQVLADDRMEGRDTGSRGFDMAADYMVSQYQQLGLHPAGTDGFRQRMGFHVTLLDEPHSSAEFVRPSGVTPLELGEDAILGVGSQAADSFDAEAVFVGYGLTVPELHYDDFSDVDVRGKFVVAVTGGPPEMPGPIKSHYQSIEERRRAFNKVGAVGVVAFQNPKAVEIPWSRAKLYRFMPRMELKDPGPDSPPHIPASLWFNLERGEKLFEGTGHPFSEITAAIEAGKPLPHFPMNFRVRGHLSMKKSEVTSQNVAGLWPGTDPTLRNEVVVLSAHLDHVGIGEPVNGDRVYSGAMDNASGCASLIEVARLIKEWGAKPRRSILFLAVTGEEKGLLGSQYYATHTTVPGPIVADLNMDMFNPLFPLKYLEVQGLAESSLGSDIRTLANAAGVEVQSDLEPEHNLFIRSDQYSFIKTGVPALAFKFSFVPGTPQETVYREWLKTRYHAPLDDLEQPIDKAGAAQFNALLARLALRVADADRRPEWNPESFFRRFLPAGAGS